LKFSQECSFVLQPITDSALIIVLITKQPMLFLIGREHIPE